MKNKLLNILFILYLIGLFSSCSMERQLALQFIEGEAKKTPLMVVPPDILFMYNDKALPPGNHQNPDSVSFYNSSFVQYISDSIFLENYFTAFIEKSRQYGLLVYLPNDLNTFLETDEIAYIARIAQMELVEDTATYLIEEKINYQSTYKEIIYNTMGLSTWFEISMKDSAEYHTYFDDQYIADEVLGEFRQEMWSFDIVYDYTVYRLDKEDIYDFATGMGKKHASYIFDLMLNSYIWNQLPPEKRNSFHYLHYNAEYHSIEVANDAFIMLEKE